MITAAILLCMLAQDPAIFENPVRLKADGKAIDTGEVWGHSGPCIADVDEDGKCDLVVGDFSGKFRFFRNVGSDAEPRYAAQEFLKAAGDDAIVPIY